MTRRSILASLVIALGASAACAQQAPQNTRIYTALFNIHYGDIPQWTADYEELFRPILDDLVAEGMLNGYNMWMHHTGGEFTIRQGFIGDDDTDYDDVWDAYLSRTAAAHPEASERSNRMILSHRDEIWNLDVVNLPTGGATKYMYEAQFRVNFADLEEWNTIWAEDVYPSMDQAIADGILQGYVIQGHNTGGEYNWKLVSLYDEWDNLDEIEAALFGAAPLDHPLWMMFTAHKDELWQEMPAVN